MKFLRIIFNEFFLDFKSIFRYKFSIISDIFIFSMLLIFFMLSDSGSSLSEKYSFVDYKSLLLIGYINWFLSIACISTISNEIQKELQRGIFYQKLFSKIPIQIIYFGKLLANILPQVIIVSFMIIISKVFFKVKIFLNYKMLISSLICIFGMYGIGLIISAVSIYYKKTGSIVLIVQLLMLFVTDTIPSNQIILKVSNLLPLTVCNEITRLEFINSQYNFNILFLKLIILSIFWFIFGYIISHISIVKAKKRGNLLMY